MNDLWTILLPVVLGAAAVLLLLPRPKPYPRLWGAVLAGLALVLAGVWLVRVGEFRVETVLFYAFSAIAITAGVLLITQSNPARAALSFALVVLATCGLFLLQAAPFLMAATIIIYAGAIIVTFLFVLMLAQQEGPSDADQRSREPLLATVAGFVLLAALLTVLVRGYDTRRLDPLVERTQQALGQSTPAEMAEALGDETFFDEFTAVLRDAPGGRQLSDAGDRLMDLQDQWFQAKQQSDPWAMKSALTGLVSLGTDLRGRWSDLPPAAELPLSTASLHHGRQPPRSIAGSARMPAENVAAVGKSLFTDYLVAVELAGLLLTVATIGAIVIAGRRARSQESGVRSQESGNGPQPGIRSQESGVGNQESEN